MKIEINISQNFSDFSFQVKFSSTSKRIGILGPSGSGKSLTLKTLAGISKPDKGYIKIDDRVLLDTDNKIYEKAQKRRIGYLFQNYALFPNMNVRENILSGLSSLPKKERIIIAEQFIQKFQLEGLEKHYSSELSGGQQQRVALARILASRPDIILLDEPFSALDSFLKEEMQQQLFYYLESFNGAVILVSHDMKEIDRFCDELLVIKNGKSIKYGKTKEILTERGANGIYTF